MQKVKWIFFGYLALCVVVLACIGVSFAVTRDRDPYTNYGSYGGNIKSLDPAEIGDTGSGDIAGYVFETLYNYEYGKLPYTLIPELAKGQPDISPDGKTMVIRLKPGIHFYDPEKAIWPDGVGPEVTADDLVYSWKRVCDQKLDKSSSTNEANYGQVFQGHVEGIDDWHDYTKSCKTPEEIDWNRPVSGLTATDRYTLRIKLVDPFPQLQFNLAMLPTAAVCRKIADHYGEHFKNHPVGTGPYVLKEHLVEQQITFEANPIYRGGVDVASGAKLTDEQRQPHIKRVQLNLYAEEMPRWYIFLHGLLDANDIPKDTFGQAISPNDGQLTPEMKADGIKLETANSPEIRYIGFNMADPVLGKNKPLRQAISMAYDRKTFITRYLNERGTIANGPIPPGFPTYDANRVYKYSRFDLDAARAKLQEAVQINGGPIPKLHILFGDTETATTQEGDYFKSQMKQIGLEVETEYRPWARFLEMVDAKQEQIYALGWVADYPDEQDFWQLYYSPNAGPGGLNSGNYSNPEFDALYDKTKAMPAGPERTKLYDQMQKIILEDCPWMFLYYPVDYTLYHDWEKPGPAMAYGYGLKAYLQMDFAARSKWLARH
jgi:oligopeptide transport system substrate-binding protein